MPIYSAFAPSVLGMQSQTQSLATISTNIANVNAGGYKRTETRFQTVLSETLQQQSDLGGVRPIDVQMIDRQGIVLSTARDLDLAIVGDGFFVVSTAITGGETFYTRDGSFEMRLETPGTGTGAATTAPGYLVDKNGYYLKGWVPDANGVFPTSGAVEALRVDADYFANLFESSTLAELGVNLPASTPLTAPTRQVDSVTLAGTIEAGDVYSVTVDGTTLSYTTTGAEPNIDTVRDALITQINAAAGVNVTASSGGSGVITLSAGTPGTAFVATASATNGGATADNGATAATTTANVTAAAAHAAAVANADAGLDPAGFHTYSIAVIDDAGTRQPVRLNFTRSATNTWEVSATHSRTPTAQVDTVTLAGTIEAGDVYSVTVSGTNFVYTTTGAEANIDAVRNALITQINAAPGLPVTAAAGSTGQISLTADVAGTSFTSSASAVNGGATADNTATDTTTTANVTDTTTTASTTLTFTATGASGTMSGSAVVPPNPITFALTFNGGSTVTFDLDLTTTTQFDSGFIALNQNVNGFERSQLRSLQWDQDGFLVGNFNNDNSRRLYKIPLATFVSTNNLTMRTGMVFEESDASGAPTIEDPAVSGKATFAPGSVESSNVEIAEEFSRMIMTQAVYNANALAFRTNDEITATARDLARA